MELVSTAQAAEILGMSCDTVSRYVTRRSKSGAEWQPGTRCYFDRIEVEALRRQEQARTDANTEEWIGMQEAMQILGLCYSGVRHRADLGLLETRMSRRGNRDRVLFNRSQCERLKEEGPRFAPRKDRSGLGMPRGWTEIDLAQLAMLIDCEGCILIHRGAKPGSRKGAVNQLYSLRVTVVNTYYPIIAWLQETFGGKIRAEEAGPSQPNWRPHYRWAVCARRAMAILELTQPYYRIKHDEVAVAIEFQQHLINSRERRSARQPISPEEIDWRRAQMERLQALKRRVIDEKPEPR